MKAVIIKEKVYDSVNDWNHNIGYYINRLVIPEIGFLTVTVTNDQIYVNQTAEDYLDKQSVTATGATEYPVKVGEVNIPDEIVLQINGFFQAKTSLMKSKKELKELLQINDET